MNTAKKAFLLFSGFLLLLSAGCNSDKGNDKNSDAGRLQKEVEEIHDESMAKIGNLRYYQDTLATLLREMNLDTSVTNTEIAEKYTSVMAALNEADDMMMDWMRNYNPNRGEMSPEERMEYLKSEKEKIEEVKKQMDEVIRKAENLLKNSN